MSVKNILICKLRYLGDVLLATPTIQALKDAFPTARMTAVVNRGTEGLLGENPHVDEVLPLDRSSAISQWRFILELRRRGFDLVIDLTDADRSALLSWMTGAPMRIGFNDERRWRGRCYTHVVSSRPFRHRVERDLAALEPLGIAGTGGTPRIWLSAQDEADADALIREFGLHTDRSIVVLQPGARYWFKAWPAERFAELADRLSRSTGCRILIGGTAQESELAERIAQASTCGAIAIAGRTSVRQFAALVKRAALFVGNDSGAMHVTAAVGTPVIGLFGPSDPTEWGPRGEQVAAIYKGVDCRACFHPDCTRGEMNCMRQISVDEVYGTALRLVQGEQTGIRRA